MRALLVSLNGGEPRHNGAQRILVSLAQGLPRLGVETVVALLEPGPIESWLKQTPCDVHVLARGRPRLRELHEHLPSIVWLRRLARRVRAEIVLSNESRAHLYGGTAALSAALPAVWWQHTVPTRNRIEFLVARIPAAAIVCPSEESKRVQAQITPPRQRIVRIYNGAPVREIRRWRGTGAQLRVSLGWGGYTLVGVVSRLERGKGQDVFLRAAARIATRHPEVRFPLIGGALVEPEFEGELERLIAKLGLCGRVRFAGQVDDVYRWMDALDIVVHASWQEGFGLVPVEAMALGKPLVSTGAGGPAETVEHERSGLLVPAGDARAMAAAIERLLTDEDLRRALSEGALRRADAFSEGKMVAECARLLEQVARERRTRRRLQ